MTGSGKTSVYIQLIRRCLEKGKQAVLLGLISSRGVDVEYLSAPTDAVITLSDNTVISSLASIWGQ